MDSRMGGGNYNRVEVIAQLFGVTVRRIQQLTQEGVLQTTETAEGRRYDLQQHGFLRDMIFDKVIDTINHKISHGFTNEKDFRHFRMVDNAEKAVRELIDLANAKETALTGKK